MVSGSCRFASSCDAVHFAQPYAVERKESLADNDGRMVHDEVEAL